MVQWIKNWSLSPLWPHLLRWCGFDPQPRNYHMLQAQLLRKKKKKDQNNTLKSIINGKRCKIIKNVAHTDRQREKLSRKPILPQTSPLLLQTAREYFPPEEGTLFCFRLLRTRPCPSESARKYRETNPTEVSASRARPSCCSSL